jgi:Ca2+/Na+ antiporter
LGVAIAAVWLETPEPVEATDEAPGNVPRGGQPMVIMLLALILTLLGGILAVRGTLDASAVHDEMHRLIYPGTLAATILSPLLILPTLGTAASVAQRGYTGRAISALVGTVLFNLCLLLPIAILLWQLNPAGWHFEITKAFNIHWDRSHKLPFDIAVWQIETVSLVVLGFGLIPVSLGRWSIGRIESTVLIIAYAVYVLMLAEFGVKQM